MSVGVLCTPKSTDEFTEEDKGIAMSANAESGEDGCITIEADYEIGYRVRKCEAGDDGMRLSKVVEKSKGLVCEAVTKVKE